ncbi:MAG: HD domain-containing phosphohydrolase, partial [Acidobacteriaceae bacterium]
MPNIFNSRPPLPFPASSQSPVPSRVRQTTEPPRIMVIGNDLQIAHTLQQAIASHFPLIQVEEDPQNACRRLASETWDIVLLDISCNELAGLEVLSFLRSNGSPAMCILIAAQLNAEFITAAVHLGIQGLLVKPLNAARLCESLDRALDGAQSASKRTAHLARVRSDVETLRHERVSMTRERAKLQQSVMDALLAALAAREVDSVPHAFRVQAYVSYFARAASYPEVLRPHLEHAALLHDIGKIGLSDNLLFRPGVLTQTELNRMRPHTILGETILARIDFLRPAAQIVRHHHEWFDGSGHPDRLHGERIPLGARLFAIIDALDAFTTNRPYRAAQSFEMAQREIVQCGGTHFDPQLTERFRQIPAGTWSKIRR